MSRLDDYIANRDNWEDQLVLDAITKLEAVRPDWREAVNWAVFDISDPSNCILGQLFDSYTAGLHAVYGEHLFCASEREPVDLSLYAFSSDRRDIWRREGTAVMA